MNRSIINTWTAKCSLQQGNEMITREQAKEELFQAELGLVKKFNPSVDIEKFRNHWTKVTPAQEIDRAWEILLDLEAA